jgi:hypothetical protein
MSENELQMAQVQSAHLMLLPPAPAPRGLTANAPNRSLHDHFLAFLASNNDAGYDEEVVAKLPPDSIGTLLLLAAEHDAMSVRAFKVRAKRLRKESAGTLHHCQCLDLLSRVFGYQHWHDACRSVRDERLANRRTNRDLISMKIFGVKANP